MTDHAVAVLALCLGAAALPATGWTASTLDPGAYLGLVLGATAFFVLGVVPWLDPAGRGRARRIGAVLLCAVPFLLFGMLEGPRPPGAWLVPAPAWGLAVGAGLLLAAVPPARATALAAAVLGLLAADALLQTSGRPLLPRTWSGARGPVLVLGGRPDPASPPPVRGPWTGAPTRVASTPLGLGPGPFYVPATEGRWTAPRPRVLVLDGGPSTEPTTREGAFFVPAAALPPDTEVAYSGFDAAVVLSGAWTDDDPAATDRADALASFARRGGLLVGPAPGRPWPSGLARRLGDAAAARESGWGARRTFGLGRVARAGSEAEIRAVLEADARRDRVRTLFDAEPGAWTRAAPRLLEGTGDPAPDRRGQGALLFGYALAVSLLDRILRGRTSRLVGLLAPVAAVAAGVVWTSAGPPPARVAGVALDLGGGGGRRVEAVLLAAGERGWSGRVSWTGEGIVRRHGGRMEGGGRLLLAPGEQAWIVREARARGGFEGEREDPAGVVARAFVRGDLDAARLRLGRIPALPLHVEGRGPVPARTLVWPVRPR